MISVEEAFATLVSGLKPLGTEEISIGEALGRVLSADACAALTYPPDDVSAMDGYAVRSDDTRTIPITLNQIGVSQAGNGFDGTVGPGQAIRIFTGAPLPAGADAVVIQENTRANGDLVTISAGIDAGTFVRPKGMDVQKGTLLRSNGHRLTARDLGLLASANVARVSVYRQPVVGYLATGDELVLPGEHVGPDQIISSNSIAMDGFIRCFGGIPKSLGIAKDNPDSLKLALKGLSSCDFLVTMGGASVGDYDLVRAVLGEEGFDMGFYKVAMRPGKPLIFGHVQRIPMLGLPGNPVSSAVTALLFLQPAIDILQGLPGEQPEASDMVLGSPVPANGQRQDYMRARFEKNSEGKTVVLPFGKQDSAMMTLLADSDCLIVRPPHAAAVEAGRTVPVIMLNGSSFSY